MARRRRRVEPVPARLVRFDAADWPGEFVEFKFREWLYARFDYIQAHGDVWALAGPNAKHGDFLDELNYWPDLGRLYGIEWRSRDEPGTLIAWLKDRQRRAAL